MHRWSVSAGWSDGKWLFWVQIKAFGCEADRSEDSMGDVDFSQMQGKMPATKV